jgi:MFS transporter, SP family, xylose:H+ symportor
MHISTRINAGYVFAIAGVAALGGLLFGYDWVVIGGAKPFYEAYFRLGGGALVGWANSCALIGCLLGSIISGGISDRFGRKKLLILSAILFCVSSVLTGWAYSFTAFVTWRVIGGVAIGIASNVSPTYIAEISPEEWRGRLVSLNQITIEVGVLAAQIVNWLIAQKVPEGATVEQIRQSWNGEFGWRWMFTAVAVPAIVLLIGSLFVPESPRWLVKYKRRNQALRTLARIGGERYSEQVLDEIERTLAAETQASLTHTELFSRPVLRILIVGIALAVLQQWSGINVIFNYAEEVYRNAGYGISDVLFNIVITGAIMLVCTLISLGFVDRVGRRPLMLFGCLGIAISHLLIGFAYRAGMGGLPVLLCTLAAISCYSVSLAPVTWVLISEIFPNRIRGAAVSISVSALWTASFILTFTFPLILRGFGSAGTFWLYAGICLAGTLFIFWRVPETKGRTLEQIEKQLGLVSNA